MSPIRIRYYKYEQLFSELYRRQINAKLLLCDADETLNSIRLISYVIAQLIQPTFLLPHS